MGLFSPKYLNSNETGGTTPPPRYILLYIFMSALFQDQVLFFLHVSFWKNEYYVLDNISPKGLEKTFIDFSNDTFLLATGIINLVHYIWGI